MKHIINSNRRSCNSVQVVEVDPILSPATAAVERLKLSPERDYKRMKLLSERDDDYYDAIDHICYHSPKILQRTGCEGRIDGGCEGRIDGALDMASFSRVSESMSTGREKSSETNAVRFQPWTTSDLKDLFSAITTKKDRGKIANEQRRLVRCIAWESRLALLDTSSSSATSHERCCAFSAR
mmetsp:Transcript_19147/g.41582  ORF Transcript_19147/g.41582 Transcript_19147/m.41582 type:complete len:182 (+) Transcript_19147:73-618(+)